MATLGLRDGFIYYRNGGSFLASKVSDVIQSIERVKEFDNGYVVVDTRLNDGSICEDYIDFWWSLIMLNRMQDREKYFKGIGVSDICVVNS